MYSSCLQLTCVCMGTKHAQLFLEGFYFNSYNASMHDKILEKVAICAVCSTLYVYLFVINLTGTYHLY